MKFKAFFIAVSLLSSGGQALAQTCATVKDFAVGVNLWADGIASTIEASRVRSRR